MDLDGIHFNIRHREKGDTSILLTAWGVDLEGKKDVLARPCRCPGGQSRLVERGSQEMPTRGAIQVDLLATHGHDGLLAAVSALFSATPPQRWRLA